MKLTDREWKIFTAFGEDGLFNISRTSSGINKSELIIENDEKKNMIPYITRSGEENGIYDFVSTKNIDHGFNLGNTLTIGSDTQTAFYQPYKFITGQSVQVISGKNLTPLVGQFILPLIRRQMNAKFNWGGNGATLARMKRLKILLPVNGLGQPDFNFMEKYEYKLLKKNYSCYQRYAEKQLSNLGDSESIISLRGCLWDTFFLNELFTIKSGVRLTNKDKKSGRIPFIGAVDNNNGVTGFISNKNNSIDYNVLGVNYNGAPGITFYHPYTAIFSDDVKRLKLKDSTYNNIYVQLFMSMIIMIQRKKYSYGYKFNARRMKRQKIYLPVTSQGVPNYKYMERYIKNILIKKYKNYLEYISKKIKYIDSLYK